MGVVYIAESDVSRSSDQTFEFQANVNWNRQFGLHGVSAMVLYRMREYRNKCRSLAGRLRSIPDMRCCCL